MSDEDDGKKKNMIVVVVCSVLLLAMVVALSIGIGRYDYSVRKEVNSSEKAIESICQPTTYQDTCIESLESSSAANATDPKELIQASLGITIDHLRDAMRNSTLLKEMEKDPRSKEAMNDCQLLAERAMKDLNRTLEQFSEFDLTDLDNWLADLKTWLSGSLTYQQTCLDGFEDIPGDYQDKMKHVLTTSMHLTSNALAMVTEISSVLSNLGVEGVSSSSKRRLLGYGDEMAPDWVDIGRHRLLTAKRSEIKPDLVVAKDGSGKYKTINEALEDIPRNSNKTFVLYIKEGVYEEQVIFFRNMTHLMVMGDGPTKTKITGSKNYIDGISTFHTATVGMYVSYNNYGLILHFNRIDSIIWIENHVAAVGDFFMARDIGFENSAGAEKHQAVALRVGADMSIFYNCQMDGYQDTLYTHTYRQFYRDCVISGTIDFIFGNGAVVLQNCTFVVRKPLENQQCIVTAQGRIDPRQPTGLVLQNCSFVADPDYHPLRFKLKSYLGRPWKEYSRTIIMESFIDDLIQKEGWLPWNGDFALDTLFYTEYNNRGPSSSKENRVQWKGVKELPLNRIERFTAARFIQGDSWIKPTGLPYNPGFIYPPPKPSPSVSYSPVVPDEIKDMGAKEKAAYDPPKAAPPPVEAPPHFSFASLFGGGGGSPPPEQDDYSTQTPPPTSTPASPDPPHSSPESTSASGSASTPQAPEIASTPQAPAIASTPASSPGAVQAPDQLSTAPISTPPASAPAQDDASTSASNPTSPQSLTVPVSSLVEPPAQASSPASPQSSTAPVSAPVQASASIPSLVQAPAQSSTTPAKAEASTPASASVSSPTSPSPVHASAPTPVSTSAYTPASSPAPTLAQSSTPSSSTPVSAPTPTQTSTSASTPAPLAPTQVPVAAPLGNSATQVPTAAPPGNMAAQVPAAAPPKNTATQVPVATPPGNSATQVPTAAPPGDSATQAPVETPTGNSATVAAPSENLANEVKVAAASENLIATPSTPTEAAVSPSAEAGVKAPPPTGNQESKSSGWTFGIF